MILQDDSGVWFKVHCSNCGSAEMRFAVGILAECRKCGLAMLAREYSQWKSDKDEVTTPLFKSLFR